MRDRALGMETAGVVCKAIMVDAADNVATVSEPAPVGAAVVWRVGEGDGFVRALESIPFGHKVAVTDIAAGETVRKYGESIGAATRDIAAGQHVHSHNMRSLRGQTDLPDQRLRGGSPR